MLIIKSLRHIFVQQIQMFTKKTLAGHVLESYLSPPAQTRSKISIALNLNRLNIEIYVKVMIDLVFD